MSNNQTPSSSSPKRSNRLVTIGGWIIVFAMPAAYAAYKNMTASSMNRAMDRELKANGADELLTQKLAASRLTAAQIDSLGSADANAGIPRLDNQQTLKRAEIIHQITQHAPGQICSLLASGNASPSDRAALQQLFQSLPEQTLNEYIKMTAASTYATLANLPIQPTYKKEEFVLAFRRLSSHTSPDVRKHFIALSAKFPNLPTDESCWWWNTMYQAASQLEPEDRALFLRTLDTGPS